MSAVIKCYSCAISQTKYNIYSVTGLSNKECYTPEDKDDEEDEGNDVAELER